LRDLGLKKVKVMSNNPDKLQAMRNGGLEIIERVALEFAPSENTFNYLHTKKTQMGHLLELTK
jgi:3,4-dihydroxy 2-butanone 4-phosphate synthase / GTP cyclohydrolase II